jgi:hypothetical protein
MEVLVMPGRRHEKEKRFCPLTLAQVSYITDFVGENCNMGDGSQSRILVWVFLLSTVGEPLT